MMQKIYMNIDEEVTAEYNIYDGFSVLTIMFGFLGYFNFGVNIIILRRVSK